jgi:hypothetical protein
MASGCNSESSNTNPDAQGVGTSSNGQVTDTWRSFCIATFTSDVDIVDPFGDVAFTAHTGQEFLLTQFDTSRVEIAYLTALGPDTYQVPLSGSAATLPFTSNCTLNGAVDYYVAFTDVTVYDTETLDQVICTIPSGTALRRDTTQNAGYSSMSFGLGGPQVFEVMLNVFSAQCGGAALGYVSVPETKVLGTNTWLVTIQTLLKAQ